MRRTLSGLLAAILAAAGAMVAPRSALAQQATCTVSDTQEGRQQEARDRFAEGQRLAEGEQFQQALVAYECSFQNVPHPSTLYNVARAAEFSGQFRRALDAWRGYLRMAPEAEDRAEIEARIAALETAAAQPTGAQPTGTQPTPGTQPLAAQQAPQQWVTPEGAPTDVYRPGAAGQEYQVVERRPPSPWRYYSWYIVGGGAALALVGLYMAIPETMGDVCDIYDEDGDYDPVNSCAVAGYSLLGVGAALMVTGFLTFALSEPGGEYVVTRRAGLAPSLAFDQEGHLVGAAANWIMRF